MKTQQKRGFFSHAAAALTAMALALGSASLAYAAPSQPVPESSQVTITKLEQPDELGSPATGEDQNYQGDGIAGIVFNYYLVDETGVGGANDIGTNAGQTYAAGLTAATAPVPATPTGSFDPTHNPTGITTTTLPRGLYLIEEDPSTVPAGVTAAAPFLLAVPLTDPSDLNAWLEHIYVYPKNSVIEATKTVENADAIVVGDDITWTITTDIPLNENPAYDAADPASDQFIAPDLFRIDDTLQDDELSFVSATVSVAGVELTEGVDYDITAVASDPAGATTHQILFTASGLAELAAAINTDPAAQIVVELVTTVLKADEISNTANVFPNSDSVTENTPLETPAADVRYGSAGIQKLSSNPDLADLSGAVFQLYSSEEAALSLDQDFLVTPTDNAGVVHSEWTTGVDGTFTIEGLRYSGYADGESFDETDSRYQTYWLVETVALDGHQLLAEPIEITVDGDTVTIGSYEIVNQETTGGFELPLTGGSGTLWLTIAGIAVISIVVIAARSRRANA